MVIKEENDSQLNNSKKVQFTVPSVEERDEEYHEFSIMEDSSEDGDGTFGDVPNYQILLDGTQTSSELNSSPSTPSFQKHNQFKEKSIQLSRNTRSSASPHNGALNSSLELSFEDQPFNSEKLRYNQSIEQNGLYGLATTQKDSPRSKRKKTLNSSTSSNKHGLPTDVGQVPNRHREHALETLKALQLKRINSKHKI